MVDVVSSGDLGVLFGFGLFETVRVYNGVPFLLDEHLRRLARSAWTLKIAGFSSDVVGELVREYLHQRDHHSYALRLSFSNGNPQEQIDPSYFLKERAIDYSSSDYENGIAAVVSSFKRNEYSEIVQHKTFNYLENYLALRSAKMQGARESIFLNTSGFLCEGSISNLFFVSKNVIRTPSVECGILPGITRSLVLQLASKEGLKIEEGVYGLDEMLDSDECFLTNSLMEVMPLVSVDKVKIGNGGPGYATKIIASLYQQSVSAYVTTSKAGG